MKINITSILICIGLIIIGYLLIQLKEKFHPNVNENNIDIPSHYINNVDYDEYMKVGDGLEANISDNSVSSDKKINICNVCQKNNGGLACDIYCGVNNNDAKFAIIPFKDLF